MASSESKRKLSAILMADAVGFSRLMGKDEASTVEAIKSSRETFRKQVENQTSLRTQKMSRI